MSKTSFKKISNYAQKIKGIFHPQKIILFGSYAYGRSTEDSDVDLLVIAEGKDRSIEKAISIRQRLSAPFPLDLIVRTPQEVKERLHNGDFFLKTILKKGKEL